MSVAAESEVRQRLFCYLVTDPRIDSLERLTSIVSAAIDGGVTAVQLRAKGWKDRVALDAAQRLRRICCERDVLFLINDRVDIALACGANGVHLGVDDLPVAVARELLGPDAVIGYSPEAEEDRQAAIAAGASYLGIGPVFGTQTKADAGPALGLPAFRRTLDRVALPCIGIGGIDQANARGVLEAGAAGVAVVSAILFADDPRAAAQELVEAMQ